MKKVLHHLISDKGLILMLLIIGSVLRFYHAFEIPFTHDEISALNRLKFDTFSELIHGGVRVDGHPALVQVFLYYWTSIVGMSELWVKLPFLILGIGSIGLTYRIGKFWFNSSAGLFAAAFVASLQYPIMYSQIARPYVSGLFFSLLLVYFWTQFLFTQSPSKRTQIGMVIAAILCSYNHYFSLLFTGIVGLTGLFFLSHKNRKTYLISMGLVLLFFLPHIEIFLYQFSGKGLDWLGIPTPYYFIEHLQYIFHFHWIVYLLPLSIWIYGMFKRKNIFHSKFQLIAIIWFMLPITIGIGYSIWVKPVVQHSMLIFSFPFLLLFITSFLPEIKAKAKTVGLICVLSITILTLINQRKHYVVFYHQPFEETFNISQWIKDKHANTTFILNDDPKFHDFYFEASNIEYLSVFDKIPPANAFVRKLQSLPSDYVLLSNLPLHLQKVAQEVYPYPYYRRNGLNLNLVVFSKYPKDQNKQAILLPYFATKYATSNSNWQPFISDSVFINKSRFSVNSEQEFGPVFQKSLQGILNSRYTRIHLQIQFKSNPNEKGMLVCSLLKEEQEVMWQAIPLNEFSDSLSVDTWNTAYLSTSLTSTIKPLDNLADYTLKVLYWNPKKQPIQLRNFEVYLTPGNNIEYAIIEPIEN